MEDNSEAKASNLSSAEAITACEDAMSEILLRLPVKSVIRFKVVSKEWKDFISRPYFRKRHKLLSLRKNPDFLLPRGLFFHHPGSPHLDCIPIPLPDCENNKNAGNFPSLSFLKSAFGSLVSVLDSCNGLVLCNVASKFRFDLRVCNMTTREFTLVPQPPDHPESRAHAYAMTFNPLESPYYRIVCLPIIPQENPRHIRRDVEILVYSSENHTWISKCCLEWQRECDKISKPAAYWNGSVVWMLQDHLFFLNLNKEEFKLKTITPPAQRRVRGYYSSDYKSQAAYVGAWGGHLQAVYIRRDFIQDFKVLEFEESSFDWYVKYTGNIGHIVSRFPGATVIEHRRSGDDKTTYVFSILAVIRGDREEDSSLLLAIPGKVISYNFVLKTVEVVRNLPENVFYLQIFIFPICRNFISCLEQKISS